MRKLLFWPALFAMAILLAPPAFALTVDNQTGMNTDGTAKFADPDEQMPGFMTPPAGAPATPQAQPSIALPVSPGDGNHVGFSVNSFGVGNSSPDAFEQDFNNK